MDDVSCDFRREHRAILATARRLEELLEQGDADTLGEAAGVLEHTLEVHRRCEEGVLFPEILRLPRRRAGAVAGLIEEHRDEQDRFKDLHRALEARDVPRVLELVRPLIAHLRDHVGKEERLLSPATEEALREPALARIRAGLRLSACPCAQCRQPFQAVPV